MTLLQTKGLANPRRTISRLPNWRHQPLALTTDVLARRVVEPRALAVCGVFAETQSHKAGSLARNLGGNRRDAAIDWRKGFSHSVEQKAREAVRS
jgi:hypothetical protein